MYLKLFPVCQNKRTCNLRHFFDRGADWGCPSRVARGTVTFRVTEIAEPVRFLVKLEASADEAGNRRDFRRESGRLAGRLFCLKQGSLRPVAPSMALAAAASYSPDTTMTSGGGTEKTPDERPSNLYLARGGADGGFKRVEILAASKTRDETLAVQVCGLQLQIFPLSPTLLLQIACSFSSWTRDSQSGDGTPGSTNFLRNWRRPILQSKPPKSSSLD